MRAIEAQSGAIHAMGRQVIEQLMPDLKRQVDEIAVGEQLRLSDLIEADKKAKPKRRAVK